MRISELLFPRLVVLITTVNKEGKSNVMTASFIMPVSFEPKYVAVSISPERYSFQNLQEVKEFGINVLKVEQKQIALICGSKSGKDVDKFKLANLTAEKAEKIKPPLIKECPISLECKVEEMIEVGDHFLVIGEVVNEKVREKDFKPLMHVTKDKFVTSEIL